MTTSQARGIKQDGLNDLNVAEYLQTYPDFFERNGPLLAKLRLPHLRDAGATEVHFRIASPPTTHSCFYGVDTPNREDLLAHKHDLEGMREFIRADSLAFVSIDGLYRAVGQATRDNTGPQFCDACFSGDYPIEPSDSREGRRQLSLLAEMV